MKKFTTTLLILSILMIGLPTFAFAGAQDFVTVNNTGVDIYHLYVSPSDSNTWGNDILGEDVLLANDSNDIVFDKAETSALWDLKISDKDGNELEWTQLDLLTISKITLNYDGTNAVATFE